MVQVGGKRLSLEDFSAIIFDKQSIEIDPVAADKVQASHRFLQDFSGQKLIYGINTGFGPWLNTK
jgi:histidine ammonia-lyase